MDFKYERGWRERESEPLFRNSSSIHWFRWQIHFPYAQQKNITNTPPPLNALSSGTHHKQRPTRWFMRSNLTVQQYLVLFIFAGRPHRNMLCAFPTGNAGELIRGGPPRWGYLPFTCRLLGSPRQIQNRRPRSVESWSGILFCVNSPRLGVLQGRQPTERMSEYFQLLHELGFFWVFFF